MGDFGVQKMFGQITEGEEKIATDTSLVVDEVLKNIGIYGPAVILALSFLYTPELSKTAGVQCFHPNAQGFTERLYMNNYCWENLKDYNHIEENLKNSDFEAKVSEMENGERSRTTYTRDVSEGKSLAYHRSFVLAMLVAMFMCILPSTFWAVIDLDKEIKLKADYLEVGIEEAFQLVIRQMVSLVKSELATTDVNEAESGGSVKARLKAHKIALANSEANPFANAEVKFECFSKLIQLKLKEQRLVMRYLNKRFITILLIIITSAWLYWLYVEDTTAEFDCRLPMSPLVDVDGGTNLRNNGLEYVVRCGLNGVAIRIFLVKILIICNILAIIFAGYCWFMERSNCKNTRRNFRIMTELAFPSHITKILSDNVHGNSDLDLLLFLTMRNLERENNKLFNTVSFALRSAEASCAGGFSFEKENQMSEYFYEHLYGIVARGMDDDTDMEAIAKNVASD